MKKQFNSAWLVSDKLQMLNFTCFRFYHYKLQVLLNCFLQSSFAAKVGFNFDIREFMFKSILCWALTKTSRYELNGFWGFR